MLAVCPLAFFHRVSGELMLHYSGRTRRHLFEITTWSFKSTKQKSYSETTFYMKRMAPHTFAHELQ